MLAQPRRQRSRGERLGRAQRVVGVVDQHVDGGPHPARLAVQRLRIRHGAVPLGGAFLGCGLAPDWIQRVGECEREAGGGAVGVRPQRLHGGLRDAARALRRGVLPEPAVRGALVDLHRELDDQRARRLLQLEARQPAGGALPRGQLGAAPG